MEQNPEQTLDGELVKLALRDLADDRVEQLSDALTELHPAEIATLLEGMPPEQRRQTSDLMAEETRGEVLAYVHEEARATLIGERDHAELVTAAEQIEEQDLVAVLDELPADLTDTILAALDEDHRQRFEAVLGYPEGTAGRLMSTNVISVRSDVTLAVVLRWLRRHRQLPPHTDALMVPSDEGRYIGKLDMSDVVTGDPDLRVDEVMKPEADTVRAGANVREVAVGAVNCLVWALVVSAVACLWFQSTGTATVIAAAMVLNLLAAALSGIAVLLVVHRLGIDPALSGAVILTTVTDVLGFLSFLGLASLFLLLIV
jgi:magnesium transporter